MSCRDCILRAGLSNNVGRLVQEKSQTPGRQSEYLSKGNSWIGMSVKRKRLYKKSNQLCWRKENKKGGTCSESARPRDKSLKKDCGQTRIYTELQVERRRFSCGVTYSRLEHLLVAIYPGITLICSWLRTDHCFIPS